MGTQFSQFYTQIQPPQASRYATLPSTPTSNTYGSGIVQMGRIAPPMGMNIGQNHTQNLALLVSQDDWVPGTQYSIPPSTQ
jgi:hypothetical protein